jgi:hypothetical protein
MRPITKTLSNVENYRLIADRYDMKVDATVTPYWNLDHTSNTSQKT